MQSERDQLPRRAGQRSHSRLSLADVTVCVADTLTPALAARALEICINQCDFGDAILFSDVPQEGRFRNIAIPRMNSVDDYSLFCLRGMPAHIQTDFALIVQWDGYIVNPSAWAASFRKYDYIGAPIPAKTGASIVGNGGFSWRSRKLLQALPHLSFFPRLGEDWIISSVMRTVLEQDFDIHFAPVALAERFSHEIIRPMRPTFGFHGVPNLMLYASDSEVIAIMAALPRPSLVSRVFFVLLFNCLRDGRPELASGLYALIRSGNEPGWLIAQMSRWVDAAIAQSTIASLELASGSNGADTRARAP